MNKKRLQRLGVVCMAAAMVLTTVSFPRAAKAEEGTLTQAEGATSTELELNWKKEKFWCRWIRMC